MEVKLEVNVEGERWKAEVGAEGGVEDGVSLEVYVICPVPSKPELLIPSSVFRSCGNLWLTTQNLLPSWKRPSAVQNCLHSSGKNPQSSSASNSCR
jgi:hypothetical protein